MESFDLAEIASVMDAAKGSGYFEDQLSRAFVPFFEKLKSISTDKRPFTMADIFQINSSKFRNFKKRYERALLTFIENFENKVNLETVSNEKEQRDKEANGGERREVILAGILPKVLKSINMGVAAAQPSDFKTERAAEVMPVHIASIQESLLEKLGTIGSRSQTNNINSDQTDKPSGKGGGLFKWLAKAGVGVAAFAVGAALLFEAFMTDGQLKGTLALIGKSLIKPAARIFDTLIKAVMRPLLSKAGDAFKGLTSFITKKLPKTGIFKLAASAFKMTGLKSIGKGAGKGLTFVFKRIPILGTIISFGFAYSRFKAGDNLGGILEIASGLAAIVPVVGTAVSVGIGVFLAVRDLKTTREGRRNNTGGSFLSGIKNWFMENKFFKGISNFFKGVFGLFTAKSGEDVDNSIDLLKDSMMFLSPIATIVSVFEFFRNGGVGEFLSNAGTTISNFGSWFSEMFVGFVDGIVSKFTGLFKAIGESLFFRKIKNKFGLTIVAVKLTFANAFNKVIEIFNVIPKGMNAMVNYAIDKWNYIVKDSDLIPDWLAIGRFEFGENGLSKFDTSGLQKDLDAKVQQHAALDKEGRDREAKKLAEKKKKEDEKRHKETMEANGRNTQAIINATKENTQAVVAGILSSNDAPNRSNGNTTIINQGSSNEATTSLRHAHYEQTYGVPSY